MIKEGECTVNDFVFRWLPTEEKASGNDFRNGSCS